MKHVRHTSSLGHFAAVSRRRLVTSTLACAALISALALALPSSAQAAFPEKPISLVVPYPPGGAADILGRIVARHLALQWPGASVIVENRAGGGTSVGAQQVAQAAPDGYTLLISSNTTWTMNPALKLRPPYDPIKSFESIGIIGAIPLVLIANTTQPAMTAQDVIRMAKAQPGKLNYASFGTGTSSHFAGELFKSVAGVDLVHVPYKGSAQIMQDLIGGQVPLAFDTNVAVAPQKAAGRIRALAVTSARRVPNLPDVPTMAEIGLEGFELTAWIAVVVPRGTAAPAREALTRALAAAVATPAMREDLGKAGLMVEPEPPAAYEARVNRELPLMRALVRRAGITVD